MESLYRAPVKINKDNVLNFQALEWNVYDEVDDEDELEKFNIKVFGVTEKGHSVCCNIKGHTPHFYVKSRGSKAKLKNYLKSLENKLINGKKYVNYYTIKGFLADDIVIEKHKEFYGFTNNEEQTFYKLSFLSEKSLRGYKYGIKNDGEYEMYSVNIDPLLSYFHQKDIQPSNWLSVKNYKVLSPNALSSCQINIDCKEICADIRPDNANLLQASFDIETYSSPEINDNGKESYPFPLPSKKDNVIYQIATCFKRLNEEDFFCKSIFTLKECNDIPGCYVIRCKDEKDLLVKWINCIRNMDPDILYQYNGDTFDWNYIYERCVLLKISSKLFDISRLYEHKAEMKIERFSSSAYGTTEYKRLKIPGRINFDVLIFIRREYKENSYKLDNIAFKYLGERKNDVSVVDIFKAYEEGTAEKITSIASYCIQDTILPQKLVDVLHILQTQISMSNVTFVPIKFLLEKGQQVKALSQISKNTDSKGYLLPFFEYDTNGEESFEGATVLQPKTGFYDCPVTTLDFASLYPSIMRAHNLCYTTIVLNKKYDNLEGVEYLEVDIDDKIFKYAKNTKSILPDLLSDLAIQRKKYKKLMANASDNKLKEIYNKTQLAYKVSMNSIYGILGSNTIGCKPIAASVTRIGREMIKQTKDYIETNDHNVYPEGYSTYDLKDTDIICVKNTTNEETFNITVLSAEKLEGLYDNYQIKTNKGWRKFVR